MNEQLAQAAYNSAKIHNELERVKHELKTVWLLRPKQAAIQNVVLGQKLQEVQARYLEAQSLVAELSRA